MGNALNCMCDGSTAYANGSQECTTPRVCSLLRWVHWHYSHEKWVWCIHHQKELLMLYWRSASISLHDLACFCSCIWHTEQALNSREKSECTFAPRINRNTNNILAGSKLQGFDFHSRQQYFFQKRMEEHKVHNYWPNFDMTHHLHNNFFICISLQYSTDLWCIAVLMRQKTHISLTGPCFHLGMEENSDTKTNFSLINLKSDAEAKRPRRHITSIAPCKAESPCRSDLAVFRKFVRSMWSDNCRADGQACVWRQSAPLSYASSSHRMCIQSQAKTCKSRYQVDNLPMSIPWTPHVYSAALVAMIK